MGNSQSAVLQPRQANDLIRAAGGLVLRRSPEGRKQVALVHRPTQEDWSFPKGKLEAGESLEECALREVLEETGQVCRLVRFLGHTQYRDRKNRLKVVAYWLMTVDRDGTFLINDEVDELRWADYATAIPLLSYERDRDLLAALAASNDAASVLT